jgi:hypothetical protein
MKWDEVASSMISILSLWQSCIGGMPLGIGVDDSSIDGNLTNFTVARLVILQPLVRHASVTLA